MASIREYGFAIPILTQRDGTIVDGHLRLKAAKKLELSEVPVVFCDGWTEAQVKAFRLLANRSANWADWDMELLQLEIADLTALGVDLNLTGFDPQEIMALQTVIGSGLTDEDSVPEVPLEPVSKRGDLWRRVHTGSYVATPPSHPMWLSFSMEPLRRCWSAILPTE
jgi:ParB-like nuclease domain